MLTRQQLVQLDTIHADSLLKKRYPDFEWLHGFLINDGKGSYHVFIKDSTGQQAPRTDKFTGKTSTSVVTQLNSSDPTEIENFIRLWLDKDFKFN